MQKLKERSRLFCCIWDKLDYWILTNLLNQKWEVGLKTRSALNCNLGVSEFESQVALQKVPFKFPLPLLIIYKVVIVERMTLLL